MKNVIFDKEVRQLVAKFPVTVSRTKRHIRIRSLVTGKFVIAPSSGSDWRGIENLKRDLKHLCA